MKVTWQDILGMFAVSFQKDFRKRAYLVLILHDLSPDGKT